MGDFILEIINSFIGTSTKRKVFKISNYIWLILISITIGLIIYICLGGTYVR